MQGNDKSKKPIVKFSADAKQGLAETLKWPVATEDDTNEITSICMFFGSAAYYAQFFEAALADFLVVYNKLVKKHLLQAEIVTLEETLHKKTMGALLKELEKVVEIADPDVIKSLNEALQKRNFLMHNFFRKEEPSFSNPKKRKSIFEELVNTGLLLKQSMQTLRAMTIALEEVLKTGRGN